MKPAPPGSADLLHRRRGRAPRADHTRRGHRSRGRGVIHTDFEKGFIKAETYSYEDLLTYGSEAKIKEAGKYRIEGKEYVVRDGDVMFFNPAFLHEADEKRRGNFSGERTTTTRRSGATRWRWKRRCGHFARKAGADEEEWGVVGLVHDIDYGRYLPPNTA